MNLNAVIEKAKKSRFWLWMFNKGLNRLIPFNRPHGFKIVEIGENYLKTKIPYRKANFNHIRGLHACGLATISEMTTGLMLMRSLNAKEYRIIMQRMEMDYHYQGKMDAYAYFEIPQERLETEIITPLKTDEKVVIPCEVKITDSAGNHLTTGRVYWQVKSWKSVKTQLKPA